MSRPIAPADAYAAPKVEDNGHCRVIVISAGSEFEARLVVNSFLTENEQYLANTNVFAVVNWPGGGFYQKIEVKAHGRPDA